MIKITGSEDFYPTPRMFLNKITMGVKWEKIQYVLEPSAGRGNIAEFVKDATKYITFEGQNYNREKADIDCIEIEPDLRSILKGKEFRVVHDDFLTFHTYKHYDLIFMNPPFSQGAKHLLKAIEVQNLSGGMIICILNAETIRNVYTNERDLLQRKLKELNAEIKFYENAFIEAENPTDVEVAVVKIIIPEPERKTTIFETLREKKYEEYEEKRARNELAETDFIASIVALYNREIEWGLRLYDEYLDFKNGTLDKQSLINLVMMKDEKFSVNNYVKNVRKKYWEKLFTMPQFVNQMTSNLREQYLSDVKDFVNYDFSYYNIKTIQIDITKNLIKGVEDCIIQLFDKLSAQHAYDDDMKNNIHYYDGWKTNKSWKINKKVILPWTAYEWYIGHRYIYNPDGWELYKKLADIEKVFNYLDNGKTTEINLGEVLKEAERIEQTKKIETKYFLITFYKKGTTHLEFKDERLLKKFNIFGSQKKGWLPKGYGKKRYQEMTKEEQDVINSFEGVISYAETMTDSNYYLFEAGKSIPMLSGGQENDEKVS